MRLPVFLLLCIICTFECEMTAQNCPVDLDFEVVYSGFNNPVDITFAPGDSTRLFIVEKGGTIRIIKDGALLPQVFLDVDPIASGGGERGLLGLAFDPGYSSNRRFYINYTDNGGDTRIARFETSPTNPDSALFSSQEILIEINQPQSNHNAGDLAFGPDGYLYIPLGDGGGQGDPDNYSQDSSEFLGKMLRIDVDTLSSYKIPADNPFIDDPAVPDEIWSFGFRNPWRISFDRETGDLWIADVGQNEWEEVNVEPAGSNGGLNYGWRCYEGDDTYNTGGCGDISNYTFPVYAYPHSFATGGYSITGGFVYRGRDCPGLTGLYVCADYVTDNVFVIEKMGDAYDVTLLDDISVTNISTFGEDYFGELYAANLGTGQIYRVRPADTEVPGPTIPSGEYCSRGILSSQAMVEGAANVLFSAFKSIELNAEFEVPLGSTFEAVIIP